MKATIAETIVKSNLQGNLLTLKRQGPVTPKTYGMVDNITAAYSGNQIASLRDDAPSVLLESSLDMASGSWSAIDFAYDRNGNQTRDMSRGVADIDYNALNLPRRIEMASGGSIEYLYSSAGTKLAEIVRDSDGTQTKRRDYAGIFEFENGEMKNISLASGYLTPADTTYHIYVPDHQGKLQIHGMLPVFQYSLTHPTTRVDFIAIPVVILQDIIKQGRPNQRALLEYNQRVTFPTPEQQLIMCLTWPIKRFIFTIKLE